MPLVVLAGKEYGSGSSRDWAAKGTALLGVRAVLAESYERIHRSNLIGMGVLPLQFAQGESAESLGLTGEETFDVVGVEAMNDGGDVPRTVTVRADGTRVPGGRADRHPRRGGLLPPRRHHAVRAALAALTAHRSAAPGCVESIAGRPAGSHGDPGRDRHQQRPVTDGQGHLERRGDPAAGSAERQDVESAADGPPVRAGARRAESRWTGGSGQAAGAVGAVGGAAGATARTPTRCDRLDYGQSRMRAAAAPAPRRGPRSARRTGRARALRRGPAPPL